MPQLKYMIVDSLPEPERQKLIKNLETDVSGHPVYQIVLNGSGQTFLEVPAEESIFVSDMKSRLKAAGEQGMATLCFLPVNSTAVDSGNPVLAGTETFTADMYAEGMEEVDLAFLLRVYERHHGLPWTILTTERCIVRELALADLDDLFLLYEGEGMTDYIEPLYEWEEEREYQEAYIRCMYGYYGYGMWLVFDKGTGKLIGRAGVEHREELGGEPELGYAIGTPYQRQGYATEVCEAILVYAGEELGFDHVICMIEKGNEVSIRLAERLGFTFAEEMELNGKIMEKYIRNSLPEQES